MSHEVEEVHRRRHNVKFCEGWLQHKAHKQYSGTHWEKLWMVLKGNIIYIFNSTDTVAENQIGNLTIDTESKFTCRGGDKEKGFKFDLTTGKRLNSFKTEKNSQRELWRAYVVGLSKGHVPCDIDLLCNDVMRIQKEIDSYISGNPVPNADIDVYRRSGISKSSSEESGVGASIGPFDGFSIAKGSYSGSSSSGSKSASTFIENGGPTLIHKFYDDRSRDQTPPSWFFSHCSRQLAETILQNGEKYGNTLMRESTSYKDNGSYVISKLVWKQGTRSYEHYEVMRTAGGYKVNVENQHDAMRSLSQVMDYFVLTSGGREHTRPMETNDPSLLGLRDPDYYRHIAIRPHRSDGNETEYDYEEPVSPSSNFPRKPSIEKHSQSLGPADSRNLAGILKTTKSENSGKTVGFKSSVHHTVAASRYVRQKEMPSMDELVNRHVEAAEIQNLDNIIGGFETVHSYVNEEELNKLHKKEPQRQRKESDNAPPPPPLPTPQKKQQPDWSYVNVPNMDRKDSLAVINSLPVAPPAPRDPLPTPVAVKPIPPLPVKKPHHILTQVTSATATDTRIPPLPAKKPHIVITHASSPLPPACPVSPQDPKGHTKLHVSHSFSLNSSDRSVASVQPTTPGGQGSILRHSHSEEKFRDPKQQTGTPSAFPSWKENLKPVTQVTRVDNNSNNTSEVDGTENICGVDERKPSGVNTLRCKFERASIGDPNIAQRQALMHGGRNIKTRRALSSVLPLSTAEDMYEILPDDVETTSRKWSVSSSDTQSQTKVYLSNNSNHVTRLASKPSTSGILSGNDFSTEDKSNNCSDASVDAIYDDTANQDTKRVQFKVDKEAEPDPTSRLSQRRKTEPCVSVSKKEFEGLTADFKNKLAGLLGGGTPSPGGLGPKSPTGSRPTSSASGEDHIYAELPIEPDEVFYVNTKYNKGT